MKVAKMYGFTL